MTNYIEEIKLKQLGNTKKDKLFYELAKIMDFSYVDSINDINDLYKYMSGEFIFMNLILVVKDIELDTTDHKDNEEEFCLCGTHIKYHYIIKNDDTKLKCWVGSECIYNFLGETINDEVKKYKAEEKWGASKCLFCEDELTNRKLKHQRKFNCCDDTCYELHINNPEKYIMKEGKYIDKNLSYVINDKDGKKYLKWIYENNKFKRYPILWYNLKKIFK